MRHGGRDTTHRSKLVLTSLGTNAAHVLQEQHAKVLGRQVLVTAPVLGEARPHLQACDIAIGQHQADLARRGRPTAELKSLHQCLLKTQQAGLLSQGPWHRLTHRAQQRARRRVEAAHLALPVDHDDTIGHLVDHQAVEQGLLACQAEAAARTALLAHQTLRQLAGQQGDQEHAGAGQPGLRQLRQQLNAFVGRHPGPQQQRQGHPRHRGECDPARRQYAGHQQRQHQQRGMVELGLRIEQAQQRESQQVDANRPQPLPGAQLVSPDALLRWPTQQPQRHRLASISQAQRGHKQRRAPTHQ